MITTIDQERVAVAQNGVILLPERMRNQAGLKPGDELLLVWLPPDTFILRKSSDVVVDDVLFAAAMREFDHALTTAGYVTDEDIHSLIKEVKEEQYAEWSKG